MFESVGTLDYSRTEDGSYRLVVDVDPALVDLYRALAPKWLRMNKQRYAPHMTIVREAVLPDLERWGRYQGAEVAFQYRPPVQIGEVYYWLEAYCPELELLRQHLGLSPTDWYTKPPDLSDCFHITIGNRKP